MLLVWVIYSTLLLILLGLTTWLDSFLFFCAARNSCAAIFVLAAVLTALYCIALACVAIVVSTSFHELLRAMYVIPGSYIELGHAFVPVDRSNGFPIHTEFPYRKVVWERLQRGESKRVILSMAEGARERMARRHYDLLNSAASVPSPSVTRCEPLRPRTFCHPLAFSHSTSLLRKLTVILRRLSAYISCRP